MKSRVLQPSLLHRVFEWQPGTVPTWIASANSCIGFDALTTIEVIMVLAAIRLWQGSLVPSVGIIFLILGFGLFIHLPFADVERFARARRRRGECINCGMKLQPDTPCQCPETDKSYDASE